MLLNVVDTLWRESKTLLKYTMPRITDDNFFGFDWYCVMGAYFMCKDALYRTPEQIKLGKMSAVFPSLHQVSDKNVTKKMSNAIQTNPSQITFQRRYVKSSQASPYAKVPSQNSPWMEGFLSSIQPPAQATLLGRSLRST